MNLTTVSQNPGHSHGKPGSHGPPPTGVGKKDMAQDSICGMVVPKVTALTTERGGRNYYFFTQTCLQTFQNPDRESRVMCRRVGFVIGGVLSLAQLRAGAFIALAAGICLVSWVPLPALPWMS